MNHLAPVRIDRLDELRDRPDLLYTPDTRVLTVSGTRGLARDGHAVVTRLGDLNGIDPAGLVFLGAVNGHRYAARMVPAADATARETVEAATGGHFENLRTMAAELEAAPAGLLYYGAALHAWHARARYCGVCGSPTRPTQAGHQRVCTDPQCGEVQFPRTDPAIITLLRRGQRALLLRQPSWPEGRFSTLAGFVEPGETLEAAVAREVAEEVGLGVVRTDYAASQPWPFPHTLMIGFRTRLAPGDVRLGDEIAEARWVTRDELRHALASRDMTIPPRYSLSRSLIEEWLGAP